MAISKDEAKAQWETLFKEKSGRDPYAEDVNDFEMKWRKTPEFRDAAIAESGNPEAGYTSYDSGMRDWGGLLNETGGDLEERFKDESNGESSADLPGGSQYGGGGGGGHVYDGGQAAYLDQLQQIIDAIQDTNEQPGVDLSDIDPGDFPVFEVPGENLSPTIDATLLQLMDQNYDPLDVKGSIQRRLLEAEGGPNSTRLQNRIEMAREELTRGQTGAMEDLRAVLADRGLMGMPGAPQGTEMDGTIRAFDPLQRNYLEQIRLATADESMRADDAWSDAIGAATGWTKDDIDRRLAATNSAQERQQMMSSISLSVLDRNIEWNKFLAEFGLKREELENEINSGRFQSVQQAIQMFLSMAAGARQGYV